MSQKTCNGLERLKSCWMSICKTWHQFFTFFVSAMFPSFTGSCRPLALELAAAKPAQKASSALKRWSSKKVEQTPANGETAGCSTADWRTCSCQAGTKGIFSSQKMKLEESWTNSCKWRNSWLLDWRGSSRISIYFFLCLPSFAPSARKQALCIS